MGRLAVPTLTKLRMRASFDRESAMRSKFVLQEGNSPDHRIRSLIFAKWVRKWNCLDS